MEDYLFDNKHLSILLEGDENNLIFFKKAQSLLNRSKGRTLGVIYLEFQ